MRSSDWKRDDRFGIFGNFCKKYTSPESTILTPLLIYIIYNIKYKSTVYLKYSMKCVEIRAWLMKPNNESDSFSDWNVGYAQCIFDTYRIVV